MAMLSSKAIYGLAAMHVLSHAPYGRAMQVREIAAMTKISHGYLEQLLSMLRRNHLISSTRGASGGYKLSRQAHEIEVIEIIEALEGPFYKIEGNVGSSLILEYFWGDIEEKMRQLFGMKLSEIDQAYQPYHYDI
ncbi:MAG: Rrf2 family transcriptional regulator [Sulfuricurvum sp. MLSB]|jgi:Rrf2 family protein|uniref:RrF2 family transcriptional regulator n=1 Tax=unclassified Sulfuricurvum TaxID=2632390 RepID=UPI0005087776|nr:MULTISPECIES: Rrf2 family transcriptional regulator [unclassified Sulfuricurvum]KFN38942.1 MAG: Rrf2 family transcriptional regulator [Sulfuricurvum sp. MLSB]